MSVSALLSCTADRSSPHVFRFSRSRACALARFSSIRLRCSSVRTMASVPKPPLSKKCGFDGRHRTLGGGEGEGCVSILLLSVGRFFFTQPVPRSGRHGFLTRGAGSYGGSCFPLRSLQVCFVRLYLRISLVRSRGLRTANIRLFNGHFRTQQSIHT